MFYGLLKIVCVVVAYVSGGRGFRGVAASEVLDLNCTDPGVDIWLQLLNLAFSYTAKLISYLLFWVSLIEAGLTRGSMMM